MQRSTRGPEVLQNDRRTDLGALSHARRCPNRGGVRRGSGLLLRALPGDADEVDAVPVARAVGQVVAYRVPLARKGRASE